MLQLYWHALFMCIMEAAYCQHLSLPQLQGHGVLLFTRPHIKFQQQLCQSICMLHDRFRVSGWSGRCCSMLGLWEAQCTQQRLLCSHVAPHEANCRLRSWIQMAALI